MTGMRPHARETSRLAAFRASAIRGEGRPAQGPHARGFTLVEALLALAIFGVIAVLSYRATASMSEGEAQLSAEAARWRTLESLFTRFEADIRQAIPRAARAGGQREAAWVGTSFEGHSALAFSRAGSEFAVEPGASGQRLGYRVSGTTLEVVYWPAIDREATARSSIYPLVSGVTSFDLAYLTRTGDWRERWPLLGEEDLPRAVKLTLAFDDGTRIDRLFTLR